MFAMSSRPLLCLSAQWKEAKRGERSHPVDSRARLGLRMSMRSDRTCCTIEDITSPNAGCKGSALTKEKHAGLAETQSTACEATNAMHGCGDVHRGPHWLVLGMLDFDGIRTSIGIEGGLKAMTSSFHGLTAAGPTFAGRTGRPLKCSAAPTQ